MPGSPSKKKRTKRKAPESDLKVLDGQAGSGKRSRAHAKASLPLNNDADESQHRPSGRAGAGKGGRAAQLEKIGAILDAPARTSQPKGATSLNADFPVNPLAPELPHKGRGSRSKIKQPPPPYTTSGTLDSNTVAPRPRPKKIKKTVAPSLNLEALNNQPAFVQREVGGHYEFSPPIVPPGTEPDLQALNNSFVAAAKAAKEQCTPSASHGSHLAADAFKRRLPSAASSDADLSQQLLSRPAIVNLPDARLYENLDPTLRPTNQSDFGLQGTDSEGSDVSEEGSDTSDGDEDGADEEIGWGESGGCHNAHPGFSVEVQPSQPRAAIALLTDFEFQHSRDEDDQAAGRALASSDSSSSDDSATDAPQPADVLELHHKKNRHPRLPDPVLLDLLRGAETANMSGSKMKAMKASKDPGDGPKSTQLAWYGPCWKRFLEGAKGECRVVHALENPFPRLVPDLSTSITESLSASLVEWLKDGNQVEADVWPARKPDMARLLYDDLSTWRSDLKKIVVAITPSVYSLIPPTDLSTQECANWVEAAAANLLDKSKYLHDGKDELGKTKNFVHPGLREAAILFIYVGSYRIAHRRPDIFCKQIPLNCLALVATVFNCILDGLGKNGNGKTYPKFSSKDYLSIYQRMLALLEDIMNDPYHGPKLVQQLRRWAEAGWAECCKLDGTDMAKYTHLQIELD
ncbi:uncharacterized protein HD556DRAFT_1447264 [Suillus plorans]|uniref:DUF6532 domain-containing protein n=1 Tax=Suillus plorans TaxID=116603 RepID=A0A9P7AGU4_9AGAM|nr:uncharacterized protein HD556DRAFT_1447264 [Suillus plorans]KAG1789204.1 hypothetical protein HD556DRAFT_1447264 [Suillus plorans]